MPYDWQALLNIHGQIEKVRNRVNNLGRQRIMFLDETLDKQKCRGRVSHLCNLEQRGSRMQLGDTLLLDHTAHGGGLTRRAAVFAHGQNNALEERSWSVHRLH